MLIYLYSYNNNDIDIYIDIYIYIYVYMYMYVSFLFFSNAAVATHFLADFAASIIYRRVGKTKMTLSCFDICGPSCTHGTLSI